MVVDIGIDFALYMRYNRGMSRHIELPSTGEKFGRLTVESTQCRKLLGRTVVKCRCSCGKARYAKPSDLRRGVITSCGCAKVEVLRERNLRMATHHMSASPEHHIWRGILTRCLCKTSKYYPRYGGRGITVSDRWRDNFTAFLEDMGYRPDAAFTVERKNNSGGYSKDNCVWATRKQQNRNKRSNRLITFNGETKPVSQWADEVGLAAGLVFGRLNRGFSVEKALSLVDFRTLNIRTKAEYSALGKKAAEARWGKK